MPGSRAGRPGCSREPGRARSRYQEPSWIPELCQGDLQGQIPVPGAVLGTCVMTGVPALDPRLCQGAAPDRIPAPGAGQCQGILPGRIPAPGAMLCQGAVPGNRAVPGSRAGPDTGAGGHIVPGRGAGEPSRATELCRAAAPGPHARAVPGACARSQRCAGAVPGWRSGVAIPGGPFVPGWITRPGCAGEPCRARELLEQPCRAGQLSRAREPCRPAVPCRRSV